jgi:hypothetical protein
MKRSILPSELFKTSQITPQGVFRRWFYYNTSGLATVTEVFATVPPALSFSFLLISAEYLKNNSKSQKNHKMKNSILLDST